MKIHRSLPALLLAAMTCVLAPAAAAQSQNHVLLISVDGLHALDVTRFVQAIYNSTLFIVSAKHGQSPINPLKVNKPGHFADLVAALPDGGTNPAAIAIANAAACTTGACGFVNDDDVALIWLQDQNQNQLVADYLNTNASALFIDEVMGGTELPQ